MIVSIDQSFTNAVLNLVNYATAAFESNYMTNQRKWALDDYASLWNGDVLNVSGLGALFDRDTLNTEYSNALSTAGKVDGGRIGDIKAGMIQIAYLAGLERAARQRYMSDIRATMLANARYIGHANGAGIFYDVLKYAQHALTQGYNGGDVGVG